MSKKKPVKKEEKEVFAVGGNLADGSRFEAGDDVPKLSAEERKALIQMGAIKRIKE